MAASSSLTPDMVGTSLKILTDKDEEICGELFAYESGFVALIQEPSPGVDPGRFSFQIVNTGTIKNLVLLSHPTSSKLVSNFGDLGGENSVDLQRVLATERKAIAVAQKSADQINPNVAPQDQQLFNSLAKTLPCRWNGDEIIIFDEVRIAPPYEKCQGKEGETLKHIQLTLEGERTRLAKLRGQTNSG